MEQWVIWIGDLVAKKGIRPWQNRLVQCDWLFLQSYKASKVPVGVHLCWEHTGKGHFGPQFTPSVQLH
eukprot:1161210-Pelagomonas_calceolata.AAC.4